MAHYIAELIQKAERSPSTSKAQAKNNCFRAILDLWSHRSELPNGKRPFEELEPIVRAIQSLDPDDNTPRYFRLARPAGKSERKTETDSWLKLASGLDETAKTLIGYCLGEAARNHEDKSHNWVKLAEAAGAEEASPEIVIRFISSSAKMSSTPDPKAVWRNRLNARLKKLEGFITLAKTVCSEWQAQLETPKRKRQVRPNTRKTKNQQKAIKK